MRIYFYSLTEQPTAHRLEPSLDEVFHNPAAFRKYFKPMMAVELSEIVPGMSGEVFFLYTTCLREATFLWRDGKYVLARYDRDSGGYVPKVNWEEDLDLDSIEMPEEGDIGDLMVDNPIDSYTGVGRYLRLHPCDIEIGERDSIIGHEDVRAMAKALEAQNVYVRYREGHFGGRPQWMQSVDPRDYEGETFVGQFQTYHWGDFYSCSIFLHMFEREGDWLVHLTYQYS